MSSSSFPVVRGRMMRVTKVDGCGRPLAGDGNSLVTEGFVSVALSANITDAEEITIQAASGRTCVRDSGQPSFDGYGTELTFCEVEPCLFQMLTGQEPMLDANGNVVGFTMNSKRFSTTGFALEVWTGAPSGDACDPSASGTADVAGYFVLPNIQGGVLGDFTIENAAITFAVTGGSTRDGNAWGVGPYQGAFDATDPSQNPSDVGPYIDNALDSDDHLGISFTTKGVPQETDGCVDLKVDNAPAVDPAAVTLSASAPVATAATVTIVRGTGTPSAAAPFPTTGSVKVHWGDGSTSNITGSTLTGDHTYKSAGTYDIMVETPADFQDATAQYVAT